MKLERGQIKDISEITEVSIQQIHCVLNGTRSKESRSGQYILVAIEIMKKRRVGEKEAIKKAMKKIDEKFKLK